MTEVVEFQLLPNERDLILKHAILPDDVYRRLKMGIHGPSGLMYRFPIDVFEDLVDCVAAELNHAASRGLEKQFDALYDRLVALIEDRPPNPLDGDDEGKAELLEQFPPHMRNAVEGILNDPRFTSMDQITAALEAVMKIHNESPQPAFAGLSPAQVYLLMQSTWEDASDAFYIRQDLSASELANVSIYKNALTTLRGLGDDGVAATKTGAFSTAFVRQMVQEMDYEGLDKQRQMTRRFFEEDFGMIAKLRYLLTYAGLIRKYKGRFVRTKKAMEFMHEERAGELYAMLLRTLYLKYDIGFPSYPAEFTVLQTALPYAAYILGRLCRDWVPYEKAAAIVLLLSVVPYFDETDYLFTPQRIGRWYFLYPLREFGLLEFKEERHGYKFDVRITPLFDRVFSISV